jgi:hypothetical protein
MDDRFAYDAVIEVVTDNGPQKSTLAEVGMGYDSAYEGISETNFRNRVFTVAKNLERAYEFWPDGEVSVNTKFIKEYVNG